MYVCGLCSFNTLSAIDYVKHCRVHSNNNVIPCGFPSCRQHFRKISTFYSHVSRFHGTSRRKYASYMQNTGHWVKCSIESCDRLLPFNDLVRHLKRHIAAGLTVHCPVEGCGRLIRKKSTFTAHISVKHCQVTVSNVESGMIVSDTVAESTDAAYSNYGDSNNILLADSELSDANAGLGLSSPTSIVDLSNSSESEAVPDDQLIMNNMANFFLKLQTRNSIPAKTLEIIATEMYSLHELGLEKNICFLKSQLLADNINPEMVTTIINELKKSDIFHKALNTETGILRSTHKRKNYYKQHFNYVEPVEVHLGANQYGKLSTFHYIPIQSTLMSLFKDESVLMCMNSSQQPEQGIFHDLCDGEVYKRIAVSMNEDTFLELILYQDAFELVNPLGSAKKIHKVVAVYLTLGNFPAHERMSIGNLQLVMLCKENDLAYFGQQRIFHSLVSDLRDLESNGLVWQDKNIPVRLLYVLGDNLGSHWLGGFALNFSLTSFFCRYCVARQTTSNNSMLTESELRTPQSYNSALNSVQETGSAVEGVVKQSVLHSLQHYHVCMPGLPPCLGHDLFEGVVKYDLALILKKLYNGSSNYGGLSVDKLNRLIEQFKFSGTDAHDKPGKQTDSKTVTGHAMQVWCFLRLLPILLCGSVPITNDAWQLLLLLREIVEIICAPRVSFAQTLYLNRLLREYVEMRLLLFPNVSLRPKHHYLLHYPWLIQMHGPLIRVWTMRLESKHQQFKRWSRSCRNFVNVTKTLSETHQLNQAFLSNGPMLCKTVELLGDCCCFDNHLFSPVVAAAVKGCASLTPPVYSSSNMQVKGTKYCHGAYVIVDCSPSVVVFGKIMLCLFDSTDVCALVVEIVRGEKNHSLGVYALQELYDEPSSVKCICIGELLDYFPLPVYHINGIAHVPLKHAVCAAV